jgi:site-specific recombinase XerD
MKRKKGTGDTMNELAIRAGSDIKEMAAILATFPDPGKWTREQKAQAVQFAALLDTAQKMIAAANVAGIDYEKEKAVFLDNAGQSDHTRRGYRNAIARLDAWAASRNINPLELSPAQADDFIYSLRNEKSEKTDREISPATVRLTTAAVSSFYTFLHRRHTSIENPVRGSKARPKEKPVRDLAVPSEKEVKTILKELPPMEAAAVSIMAGLGLRCGALPTLEKRGERYHATSKGKGFFVDLAPDMIKRIEKAGLSLRAPFAGKTTNSIELIVAYYIKKLYQAGAISAAYSCHDFRHYAAVREYTKNHDIKRVKEFLHHSSISITERYLRSLGIKD